MSDVVSPLRFDPSFAAARESVQLGELGRLLAIYATARAKGPRSDPLFELGLPLLEEIVSALNERPVEATGTVCRGADGFELWTAIVRFESGVRATIDIGAGLAARQVPDLDLRVEWTGTERVILVEPARAAVTVANLRGVTTMSAEVAPVAEALEAFAPVAVEIGRSTVRTGSWESAAWVIRRVREAEGAGDPSQGRSPVVDRRP